MTLVKAGIKEPLFTLALAYFRNKKYQVHTLFELESSGNVPEVKSLVIQLIELSKERGDQGLIDFLNPFFPVVE